jgi:hypothetical protein
MAEVPTGAGVPQPAFHIAEKRLRGFLARASWRKFKRERSKRDMSIEKYFVVYADEVAQEMASDGEFAMDVLAYFCECAVIREVVAGCNGSDFHREVPEFLRTLADQLLEEAE